MNQFKKMQNLHLLKKILKYFFFVKNNPLFTE